MQCCVLLVVFSGLWVCEVVELIFSKLNGKLLLIMKEWQLFYRLVTNFVVISSSTRGKSCFWSLLEYCDASSFTRDCCGWELKFCWLLRCVLLWVLFLLILFSLSFDTVRCILWVILFRLVSTIAVKCCSCSRSATYRYLIVNLLAAGNCGCGWWLIASRLFGFVLW